MIEADKGHIVSIASVASFLGVGGMSDYCSTKAGVLSFHECKIRCILWWYYSLTSYSRFTALNQELKYHYKAPNVLTTSVHPLWVKTPLIKDFEKGIKGPLIDPQLVADNVVEQIIKAEGGQIFLPRMIKLVSLYRGIPNWIQEFVRASPSRDVLSCLK